MLEALGWGDETLHVRRFEGGATLALPALVQLRDFWGETGWKNPLGADFLFAAYTQYTGGAMFANDLQIFLDETGAGPAA